MKQRILTMLSTASALAITSLFAADDAELLTGKWSIKKVTDSGDNIIQTIEIKKDKFVFEILTPDNQVRLHAEGDAKFEKLGPFNSIRFYHIRGGLSANELQDVDEERAGVYVLDGDNWTLATNFERDRQGQKPSADMYQRVKGASASGNSSQGGGTLVIDEVEMTDTPQAATWYFCLETTVEGTTRRYYVENKGYDKNKVTIPMMLEIPRVKAGQKCSFKMQLDDIDGDACSDEPDNRAMGSFVISDKGSQSFKPEDNWRFTIRWHLKP